MLHKKGPNTGKWHAQPAKALNCCTPSNNDQLGACDEHLAMILLRFLNLILIKFIGMPHGASRADLSFS